MTESELESGPAAKAKRGPVHRSPSFPAIDLKTAIDRARTFYQHEKRSPASVLVASSHWGYSPQSSGGKQTLAALIAYGLMEDEGSGDQRKVRLTDLAFRILLDERPDSPERDEAIRRAAHMPKIHAEIFARSSDALPSDPNLRHFLVWDKKFNENSVGDFIRQLRSTAEFAGVYAPARDGSEPDAADPDEGGAMDGAETPRESPGKGAVTAQQPSLPPSPMSPPSGAGMRQDTFSLDEGLVVLQWPAQLSAESYEDLKDWMELQLRKIGRSVRPAEE